MRRLLIIAACAAAPLAGCASNFKGVSETEDFDSVRLLGMSALEPDVSGDGMQLRLFVQTTKEFEAVWFRFELYEFMPLAANPRGKRLMLWPQIEPGLSRADNPNWRRHLEAYEFILPIEPKPAVKVFLAEVTAMGKDGLRRSAVLKVNAGRPKPQ